MSDNNIDLKENFGLNEEKINSPSESSNDVSIKQTFDTGIAIERIHENEITQKKRAKKNKKDYKSIESANNNILGNLSEVMNAEEMTKENDKLANITEIPEEIHDTIASSIEALLFASDEPIFIKLLSEILSEFYKETKKEIIPFLKPNLLQAVISDLNKGYGDRNQSFHIIEIAGGFQFATLQEHAKCLGILFKEKSKRRLSQSALETLAIIAFKQPISKPDIENIRGVNSDYVLSTLLEKDLVSIVGRADSVGKPLLYGTTSKFLKHFGLKDFKDMPKLKEVEEIMNSEEFKFEVKRLEDSLNKSENDQSTGDEIKPEIVPSSEEIMLTNQDSHEQNVEPEKFESLDTLDDVKKKSLNVESYDSILISDTIPPTALSFIFNNESNLKDTDSFLFDINFDTIQYRDTVIDEITQELIENESFINFQNNLSEKNNIHETEDEEKENDPLLKEHSTESNIEPTIPIHRDIVIDEITQELIENESFVNFQNNLSEKSNIYEAENEEKEEDLPFKEDSTESDIEPTISIQETEQVVISKPETYFEMEHIINDADVLEEDHSYILEGSPILPFQNLIYNESEETEFKEATVNDIMVEHSQEQSIDKEQQTEFIQNDIDLFEEKKVDCFVESEMFVTQTIENDNIFNDIKFDSPSEMDLKSSDIEKFACSESETTQDKCLDSLPKKNKIDIESNLFIEENVLEKSNKTQTVTEQKMGLEKTSFFARLKLIVIRLVDKLKKFFSKVI